MTDQDREQERQLAELLERGNQRPPMTPLQRFLNARFVAPGLALVGLLVLFFSYQEYRQAMTTPHAAAIAAPNLELAVAPAAAGGVRLSWQAHPEGEGYRVVLYSSALQEVARYEVGKATFLELEADQWRIARVPGEPLIWRVEILRAGKLLGASIPNVVPADEKRQ